VEAETTLTSANDLIIQRIKTARLQRNLTQKNLADKLGKTSAAISDLERGKTQVAASDLVVLSDLLGKPIEYFYGEDFSGSDVEDIIALIRRMPMEPRKEQLSVMITMLSMFEIGNKAQAEINEEKRIALAKNFYDLLVDYFSSMDKLTEQLSKVRISIEKSLGFSE
jgi:transcriptional regulator with XRE-family HTH domain